MCVSHLCLCFSSHLTEWKSSLVLSGLVSCSSLQSFPTRQTTPVINQFILSAVQPPPMIVCNICEAMVLGCVVDQMCITIVHADTISFS